MNPFIKPQYLTDGGLETTLVFEKEVELREFAAFELLNSESGKRLIQEYYAPYLQIALVENLPFVFETPTWRLNHDWAFRLGYSEDVQIALNKQSVAFMRELQQKFEQPDGIVSGCIGPRGDGYQSRSVMTVTEATFYHHAQIKAFAEADADIVSALTMTNVPEAIGISLAARKFNVPVVISFTLETDGKLPDGSSLENAILETDAQTGNYVTHYMINCAHPTHFMHLFSGDATWQKRIAGIRANASCKSHEELDNSTELDRGDPHALGNEYKELSGRIPWLKVLGGCCGTDHEHIREIVRSVSAQTA